MFKEPAEAALALPERILCFLLFGNFLAADEDARGSSMNDNRIEKKLKCPVIEEDIFGSKRAFPQCSFIERREECRYGRGKQIAGSHSSCNFDSVNLLKRMLQCPIECNQAIIQADRPKNIFGAFNQGREIRFHMDRHSHDSLQCPIRFIHWHRLSCGETAHQPNRFDAPNHSTRSPEVVGFQASNRLTQPYCKIRVAIPRRTSFKWLTGSPNERSLLDGVKRHVWSLGWK